jgi:hypothetical protein
MQVSSRDGNKEKEKYSNDYIQEGLLKNIEEIHYKTGGKLYRENADQ